MKILAVDDDPISRAPLEATLNILRYEVVSAVDGQEAWEILGREPIRIVVCDWRMPKVDGLELCRRIRERMATDYIYFILLTAMESTSVNEDEALRAGVDDFLEKPINPRHLRQRIQVAERILNFTSQVRQLEGILPMCSYCKSIRDDQNYWDKLERYIGARTGTSFSHSVCPGCYAQHVAPQMKAMGVQPPPLPSSSPRAMRVV